MSPTCVLENNPSVGSRSSKWQNHAVARHLSSRDLPGKRSCRPRKRVALGISRSGTAKRGERIVTVCRETSSTNGVNVATGSARSMKYWATRKFARTNFGHSKTSSELEVPRTLVVANESVAVARAASKTADMPKTTLAIFPAVAAEAKFTGCEPLRKTSMNTIAKGSPAAAALLPSASTRKTRLKLLLSKHLSTASIANAAAHK